MEIFKEVEVYTSLESVSFKNPVVTIGVFDGLHRGHQALLDILCSKAAEFDGESVVITFWPHPRLVLGKAGPDFNLLSTLEEKEYLFGKWGIDKLIVLPFTPEFSKTSGEDFIKNILIEKIGVRYLVMGDDHRFGNERDGGRELLLRLSKQYGFGFVNIDASIDLQSRISSSLIREALKSGDLSKANKLLGFPYFILGRVIEGNQIGRKIGFPTANIDCCADNKQVPNEGVYVVEVEMENQIFGGMLNIGVRPTVDNTRKRSIEVHIFDLEDDIYNRKIKVNFLHRIRDELKFNNWEELKQQLKKDREDALGFLRRRN